MEDGKAMGSPFGPCIAGIFMIELERNLLPTSSQYMASWKRYVDESISYVKVDCIENVLNTLNSFHANISLPMSKKRWYDFFLRFLIMRKKNTIETSICCKQTHNDI